MNSRRQIRQNCLPHELAKDPELRKRLETVHATQELEEAAAATA